MLDLMKLLGDIDLDHFNEDDAYDLRYDVECDSGATKFVIFDNDVVYKIPFKYESYYDEESSFQFKGGAGEEGWDYCEAEVLNYAEAVDVNVEMFFEQTKLFETVKGYPIYVQNCVTPFHDVYDMRELTAWEESEEGSERITSLSNSGMDTSELPIKWIDDAVNAYGETAVQKLLDFLDDVGINDCCARNVGYNKITKKPVIFDYAGYYD